MSKKLQLLVITVLLGLYQLSAGNYVDPYIGFSKLRWAKDSDCQLDKIPKGLERPYKTAGTWLPDNGHAESVTCTSEPFELLSNTLEIELAGSKVSQVSDSLYVEVFSAEGSKSHRIDASTLGSHINANHWESFRFSLPNIEFGQRVRLRLVDVSSTDWIVLRSKTSFYKPPSGVDFFRHYCTNSYIQVLIIIALVIALIAFGKSAGVWEVGNVGFVVALLVVAFCVHLRPVVFFYWDEWHVLNRFSELGLSGVIYTHNEHFLPLFFFYYYLQAGLLGDSYVLYLCVGILIHVLNCVLLARLLTRLLDNSKATTKILPAAKMLTFLYSISALHSEVLQWSFEQSVLLVHSVSLIAFLTALEFVSVGKVRYLVLCVGCSLVAPLIFGNGFVLPMQLGAVCVFASWQSHAQLDGRKIVGLSVTWLRRVVVLLLGVGVMAGLAALLYSLNKDVAGHGVENARMFENLTAVVKYIFVGSQLGCVLRGVGLFPALENEAALYLFPSFASRFIEAEMFFAVFGAAVSALLLVVPLWIGKDRLKSVSLWILGQLILVSSFLLPALGRWQLGLAQSLSLRYDYGALIGLCIASLPAVYHLMHWGNQESRSENLQRVKKYVFKIAFPSMLFVSMSVQLWMGARFDYFVTFGSSNRDFVSRLQKWNGLLSAETGGKKVNYEGNGTSLSWLHPSMPDTVAPGMHPDGIYRVLHWLDTENYPLRSTQSGRS